jgi:outer membrane protein OmpA-like peptidoglycan-associated protein
MPRFSTVVAVLMLGIAAAPAAGQSADEINRIIRGLAPIAGQTVAGEGSNMLAAPAPGLGTPPAPTRVLVEVVVQDSVIFVDPSYALDFEVYFPFDSAELTSQARSELAALGRALSSSELRPYRYLIAGHTDAVGNAAYNQALSEHRALAVRRYLLETFPIAPERLVAIGFGQERLKRPDQPRAAVNRRVEVLLIATP